MPLNQIAFSVVDLRRTESGFREGCGFPPAGGNRTMMSGPLAARIRFPPGIRGTDAVLRALLSRLLSSALRKRLKPLIESAPGDIHAKRTAET
jgi:hypothetical protein